MKIDESWYIKPENIKIRIGAGGIVIRKEDGKLLICLLESPGRIEYVLPKGGVIEPESLEEAAKREIREETGITKVNLIKKLGTVERLTMEKDYWGIWHFFLFVTDEKSGVQDLQEDEAYEVRWFEIDKLPEFFWPEQERLVKENLQEIINNF